MLSAESISVSYGGVHAVRKVDLTLAPGEFLGLIGPNGSGKSTLLNALCGITPASGRVSVAGHRMRLGKPTEARRLGIARVFQAPQSYPGLSAVENVLIGGDQRLVGIAGSWLLRPLMWRYERARCQVAYELLERLGIHDIASESAETLSYGQRRLIDLARAMIAAPRVILLDEPSAGLNDAETAQLAQILRDLNQTVPMIIVDHKIQLITELCDRVMVLDMGAVVADGAPQQVLSDPNVIRAYLGGTARAVS